MKGPSESSPDLLPVLNLVAVAVPLGLLAQRAWELGQAQVETPAICARGECDTGPRDPAPMDLELHLDLEGIVLRAQAVDATLPCEVRCDSIEAYDLPRLQRVLSDIKDMNPHAESLTIYPSRDVPYELIVAVMDTVREEPLGSDGSRSLFPFTVVSAERVYAP